MCIIYSFYFIQIFQVLDDVFHVYFSSFDPSKPPVNDPYVVLTILENYISIKDLAQWKISSKYELLDIWIALV